MKPFPNISSGWAVKADEQHHDNADQNGYVKLTHEMSSKKIIKIVCIFCLQFLSKETLSNSHHKNGKIYHEKLVLFIFFIYYTDDGAIFHSSSNIGKEIKQGF